jgi:branched-chain amino acid aminotransferase
MANLCNVNGKILPEEQATISVLDRGFLFGDSIYEVTRTVRGCPFAWPEHLERLHRSADGLRLELPLDDAALTCRVMETLAAADHGESYIRVIVTRGVGSAPNIDMRYATGPASLLIMVRPLPVPADGETQLAIVPRLRNDRRALDPAIKSGNYLNNVMGLREAQAAGATECVFLNHEGRITEASTSNVWIVEGNGIATPALDAGLLAGITRHLLTEMCGEQGIRCVERDLFEPDLRQAEAIFLSSSLRDISPVTRLDGRPVGSGGVHPFVADLIARFSAFVDHRVETVYRPGIAALCGQPAH